MKIYDRTDAISKAQIEVWEIRERLYDEIKDMSVEDALKYITGRAKIAGDEYRKMIDERKKNIKTES
jgi:hypothetical protein